jgi:hypothetical protein
MSIQKSALKEKQTPIATNNLEQPSPAMESKQAHTKATWGPSTAVLYGVFVFFAAQIIALFSISLYPRLENWGSLRAQSWLSSAVGQFWYVLVAEIITFGAIWWFVTKKQSSLRMLGLRNLRLSDVGKGALGFGV